MEYLSHINNPIKNSGDSLVFEGRIHVVHLVESLLAHTKPIIVHEDSTLTVLYSRNNHHTIQDALTGFMRRHATKILPQEIRALSQKMNLPFNRLTIRHAKTRWGSCSSEGNINLNWQLIRVDERLRTYVMIHELCHLVHMDHSRNFWELVAHHCPEYKALRAYMKKVNPHWIDRIYKVGFWKYLLG